MMELHEVMQFLAEKGSDQTKKVWMKHGAREPFFGTKVADLKVLLKKIKKDHQLALQLYDTGNSDAMYLAGLLCDAKQFTPEVLNAWVEKAYWYMISDFTVAGAAAESNYAVMMAKQWINSGREFVASAGWSAYSGYISITPNEKLDIPEIEHLLEQVASTIHQEQNRVRQSMNNFVIAVGSYIPELTEKCKLLGKSIGKVTVDMGGTSCKVPDSKVYIEKVEKMGNLGKKRKRAFC
jgi:3-methyladenine DNA glycosylase AlkD